MRSRSGKYFEKSVCTGMQGAVGVEEAIKRKRGLGTEMWAGLGATSRQVF